MVGLTDRVEAIEVFDGEGRLVARTAVNGQRQWQVRLPHAAGTWFVVFRTPDWQDFVELSCREIRLYGAENYQVARRMRAMLENLVQQLPATRAPAPSVRRNRSVAAAIEARDRV